MGAASSKPEPAKPTAEMNEKTMIVERPGSLSKPSVEVEEALTSDNISKWTKDLDEVSLSGSQRV
jgi:hypothetical protein